MERGQSGVFTQTPIHVGFLIRFFCALKPVGHMRPRSHVQLLIAAARMNAGKRTAGIRFIFCLMG